jgi:hypothetical protein
MTILIISITENDILALEYCVSKESVKYVESFDSWTELLNKLDEYMDAYAIIEVGFDIWCGFCRGKCNPDNHYISSSTIGY